MEITSFVQRQDVRLVQLIGYKENQRKTKTMMKNITHFGSCGFALLLPMFFYIMPGGQNAIIAKHLLLSLVFSQFFVHLLKRIFKRTRPYRMIDGVIGINPPKDENSLPSGHTNAAFSLALMLSVFFPWLSLPLFVLASMVGVSRVYLGVHYPSDVILGYLIALTTFVIYCRNFM